MKKLLTAIALLALTATSFANEGQRPTRPGQRKATTVVVKGKRAAAIFNALDVEVVTRNAHRFSLDVKKVAGLKCFKATKKTDTKVSKYRCALRGLKVKKPQGRRGHGRRGRRHDQGQATQTDLQLLTI
ncbi:MAG: hypothetical protein HN576_14045 [Bacteriovoracaceae bacterium]|jgi:hypothetical protein|nr:hypothetical protein [Bacteriovoracaceae bacterium]